MNYTFPLNASEMICTAKSIHTPPVATREWMIICRVIWNERLTCFAITSTLGPHGNMMAVEVRFVCDGES